MVVGAQDSVFAVCTNASGAATSGVITIKPPNGVVSNKPFGSFPRVRYVQDLNGGAGAFIVIWQQEEVVGAPQMHSRIVSCTAGLLGTDQVVSGGSPPWTDYGASSFAYSPTSQKFLVAWKAWAGTGYRMVARLMDLNGAGVGSVVTLSTEFARDPGVAWNSNLNEFGVSFSGEAANGRDGYSVFVRMPADNPAGFARTTFNSVPGCMTTTTDLAYNPDTQRYIMTWWQGCGAATKVAEFDGAGTLQTIGLVSSTLGSYDALSLAYNPASKTFALIGIERVADHAVATELNSRGYKISSEIRVESDPPLPPPAPQYVPIRYPRVTSHASNKSWLAALNMGSFVRTASQILTTTSSDGGAPGSHPEPGACSVSLSPTSGTEPATGGTGSFAVTATAGCGWTATTAASWVHITSGASGSGSGTVVYTADVNTGGARSATITVGSQSYIVNQSGTTSCTYAISPTSGTEPATGGIGSFVVTTGSGCAWTATTAASWVHITAGASGTGSGTVSYSADAQVGPARAATISAGGQSYTVNQLGNCTYTLSPTSSGAIPWSGATNQTFAVTTTSGCTWAAATTASWIHVTSGSGSASGTVTYSVDTNTGSARADTITLSGRSFTVTQDALVVPIGSTVATVLAKPVPPPGVSGVDTLWQSSGVTLTAGQAVTVTGAGTWADAGVSLTAAGHPTTTVTGPNCPLSGQKLLALIGRVGTSGTPFLIGVTTTFTPSSTGLLYLAPQDNWYTTWDNSGSLTVIISPEAGSGSCTYEVSPASSGLIAAGGGSGSFTLTATGTGCNWTATTSASWIHVTTGNGTGSGSVAYTVDANSGAARAGTITVGGQSYAVSQDAFVPPPGCTTVAVAAKPTPPPGVGGVEIMWQSSGVMLTAGQAVTLVASGTWSNAGVSYTAAGHATTTVTGPNCPLSGQKLMALIGRVGLSGTPFLIGTTTTFTPSSTGLLYLAPQDNWYTIEDNAGSLSVSVCADAGSSCSYSLNPASSGTVVAGGGNGSFNVTTQTGCSWTATTAASWVHVTSGGGTSSGSVSYTVDANTGAARTGTITVDDQTYTVTQAEAAATSCTTVAVQAKPTPPPGVGGVETLWQSTGITVTAGQPLTVTATGTWSDAGVALTAAGHPTTTVTGVNCPLSGQPLLALIGRIGASGAPFLIGASKTWTPSTTGTLYLAPQDNWYTTWDNAGSLSVSVCRDASGTCSFVLNPTNSGTLAATGASGSFTVTTGGSCTWTPTTGEAWIHVTSGSGPGSATVNYTVDVNSAAARTGSITVGGQTFTVSQAADASSACDTATVQAKPPNPSGVGGVDPMWQSTGVTLTAGQPIVVTASGSWIDAGVTITAAGHPTTTVTGVNCPLSGAPLLALVGRIGPAGAAVPDRRLEVVDADDQRRPVPGAAGQLVHDARQRRQPQRGHLPRRGRQLHLLADADRQRHDRGRGRQRRLYGHDGYGMRLDGGHHGLLDSRHQRQRSQLRGSQLCRRRQHGSDTHRRHHGRRPDLHDLPVRGHLAGVRSVRGAGQASDPSGRRRRRDVVADIGNRRGRRPAGHDHGRRHVVRRRRVVDRGGPSDHHGGLPHQLTDVGSAAPRPGRPGRVDRHAVPGRTFQELHADVQRRVVLRAARLLVLDGEQCRQPQRDGLPLTH